jgi:hypothetical protein
MTFLEVAEVVGDRSGRAGRYVVARRDLQAGEQVGRVAKVRHYLVVVSKLPAGAKERLPTGADQVL